jgi:Zn-dependent protease with chaperone function
MCKIIRIGLVALYILLICFSFLLMLAVSGVFISWWAAGIAMTAWTLTCWLSVYYLSPIYLFFQGHLRKPYMEEEAKLRGCLMEVEKSASCTKKIHLLIAEANDEKIFNVGNNTMAISAPLLKDLTEEELKGVMAHELGHLISRDTMVSWAFATASRLPGTLRRPRLLWKLLIFLPAIYFIVQFFSTALMFMTGAAWMFLVSSVLLDALFTWLHLLLLRQRDYRQDAFAHRLGYGRGLRDALKKLAATGEQKSNHWFILLHGRSPVIYHRIRRLDQLMHQ